MVSLVWDISEGYPTNPVYRDYHRRTVHDLRPWNHSGDPYKPYQALALAREHARDFVRRAIDRLDAYRAERGRPGLLCCALDTELLGHWWYEGRDWLAFVIDDGHSGNRLKPQPPRKAHNLCEQLIAILGLQYRCKATLQHD